MINQRCKIMCHIYRRQPSPEFPSQLYVEIKKARKIDNILYVCMYLCDNHKQFHIPPLFHMFCVHFLDFFSPLPSYRKKCYYIVCGQQHSVCRIILILYGNLCFAAVYSRRGSVKRSDNKVNGKR